MVFCSVTMTALFHISLAICNHKPESHNRPRLTTVNMMKVAIPLVWHAFSSRCTLAKWMLKSQAKRSPIHQRLKTPYGVARDVSYWAARNVSCLAATPPVTLIVLFCADKLMCPLHSKLSVSAFEALVLALPHATKQKSMKKSFFVHWERARHSATEVRYTTPPERQPHWRGRAHSMDCRTLRIKIFCAHPLPKAPLL